MSILASIRALWSRHFGSKDFTKESVQILRHRQGHAHATNNMSFGGGPVLNEVSKSEVDLTIPNPHLGKQVSADRANILATDDLNVSVSQLNNFAARGFRHRSFVLFQREDGSVYALDGSEWSRK